MSEDELFEELKDLMVTAAASVLADIELLSKVDPEAGARAKEEFIYGWAGLMVEAGYQPKM